MSESKRRAVALVELTKKPGLCASCQYWKHQPGATIEIPSIIAGAPPEKIDVGMCFYTRPMLMGVIVRNALGQPEQQLQRTFPTMGATEFCADNPDRLREREYVLEMMREKARRSLIDYNPEKYGDAHAGFSAAPSLVNAKALANVADGRNTPDAPTT